MKCEKCQLEVNGKMDYCPFCGTKISKTTPIKSVGRTVAKDVGAGLSNILVTGIKLFQKFPSYIQYILLGMIMLITGYLLPWNSLGLGLVQTVLALGGIVLAIAGFGLIPRPKSQPEKKDTSTTKNRN